MRFLLVLCASCMYILRNVHTGNFDVLYAPTTNGTTGPQQTNGGSLIILYLLSVAY